MLLDELEHGFGRPLVHQDHGVPQVDRGSRVAQHGRVVERGAHDVDVVVPGLDAEQEEDAAQAERRLFRRGPAQRAEHPFRVAGGPRRVVHDVADGPVRRVVGGLAVTHGGQRREADDLADGEARRRRYLRFVGGVEGHVGEALVGDEHLGPRVLKDVGHLGCHQMVVDRDQVPTGLQGGQVELEDLYAVGEQGGDNVTGSKIEAP